LPHIFRFSTGEEGISGMSACPDNKLKLEEPACVNQKVINEEPLQDRKMFKKSCSILAKYPRETVTPLTFTSARFK
jgi:hypothetical protein